MNIRAWADSLPKHFFAWGSVNAYPRNAERFCAVMDSVQGMTTPSNMLMLNLAVQCMKPGEIYLEVGTWRGATLIGALLDNKKATGFAIDNDTMNDHDGDDRSSQDVWRENLERFGLAHQAFYIDGSVPEVWSRPGLAHNPVGVYFFDGDKSTPEAAYDGLAGVLPFLADEALILIDDANEMNIALAAAKLERENPKQLMRLLWLPTPGNCWTCFWDGVMALAFKR